MIMADMKKTIVMNETREHAVFTPHEEAPSNEASNVLKAAKTGLRETSGTTLTHKTKGGELIAISLKVPKKFKQDVINAILSKKWKVG